MPDADDDEDRRRQRDLLRDANPELQALIGQFVRLNNEISQHAELTRLDDRLTSSDAADLRGQADLLREAAALRLQLAATLDDLAAYVDGLASD